VDVFEEKRLDFGERSLLDNGGISFLYTGDPSAKFKSKQSKAIVLIVKS
jgi:hypothetical protein